MHFRRGVYVWNETNLGGSVRVGQTILSADPGEARVAPADRLVCPTNAFRRHILSPLGYSLQTETHNGRNNEILHS